MRIFFEKLESAKKSAKAVASVVPDRRLSDVQRAVAKAAGYRDWHDVERNHKAAQPGTLDLTPGKYEFDQQIIARSHILSEELDLFPGDALYAISRSYLPGTQIPDPKIYEAIWLKLFSQAQHIQDYKRSPGNVVRINAKGWNREPAILKNYGRPTTLVTHGSVNTWVADFEITVPRKSLDIFVPARLKLPYGYWTETDGSTVLFSRDYKPLWRLIDGRKPVRLAPWLWIDNIEQKWFWSGTDTPWDSPRRLQREENRLREYGITALPKLVDVLADIVFNEAVNSVCDAVDVMARREDSQVIETLQGWIKLPEGATEPSPNPPSAD